MANPVTRIELSGSTGGAGILVAATSTPGTAIHSTGISATVQDEVRLYAFNGHTADVLITVEWGGASNPFKQTIPFNMGLVEITPPQDVFLIGTGSVANTVKIFAGTTNVVVIFGGVYRTTVS